MAPFVKGIVPFMGRAVSEADWGIGYPRPRSGHDNITLHTE